MQYAKGKFISLSSMKTILVKEYKTNILTDELIRIYGRYIPKRYSEEIRKMYPLNINIQFTNEEKDYIIQCEELKVLLIADNKTFEYVGKEKGVSRTTIQNKYLDINKYHYPEYFRITLTEERRIKNISEAIDIKKNRIKQISFKISKERSELRKKYKDNILN